MAKTSVKVPICCIRRRWSETWSWRKCTNGSKLLSDGEGKAKEASTSTHALIMEARGMSSVRACVVSVPGEEEGKSHRKISSPLDMTEVS